MYEYLNRVWQVNFIMQDVEFMDKTRNQRMGSTAYKKCDMKL